MLRKIYFLCLGFAEHTEFIGTQRTGNPVGAKSLHFWIVVIFRYCINFYFYQFNYFRGYETCIVLKCFALNLRYMIHPSEDKNSVKIKIVNKNQTRQKRRNHKIK